MGSKLFSIPRRCQQRHIGNVLTKSLNLELSLISRNISAALPIVKYSKSNLPLSFPQLTIERFYSYNKNEKLSCNNNLQMCIGVPNCCLRRITRITGLKNNCYSDGLLNFEGLLLNFMSRRNLKTSALSQDAEKIESKSSEDIWKAEKIMRVKLKAQRLDAVLKAGLGMSRNKVEKAIYDDRVRVNGVRPVKKSQTIYQGDEVDIVRGYNELNPESFIDVSRVEIEELSADDGNASSGDESDSDDDTRIPAVLRRSKLLTIRNYPKPWKGSRE